MNKKISSIEKRQKKEIFDNKKLLEKMKLKLEKENEKKFRHKNIIEEDPQY